MSKEKKNKEEKKTVSEVETTEENNVEETKKDEKSEPTAEEVLQKQIEDLQKELAIAKNAYYKAYADTENLKKRLYSDAEKADKYRIQTFATDILPALDALQIALAGKDINDPFVKGVKLTYDQIIHALAKEGVSPIDCLNKPFDANYQHAIMTEKVEGTEPNMVVEVLQTGYMLKDRLLRAALVKVSE
ncbi:MAG: nucleotide exchange factor GrpE [Erysipelotrichia bacterium]|nr:nucleotide exchange factor GrpE [Erysipelotrichia bacterium]